MTVERDQWCGDREEIMWGEDRRESSGFSLEELLVALMRRALVVGVGGGSDGWEMRTQQGHTSLCRS